MSALEIALYCIIGSAVLFYLARGIYIMIDAGKHPEKYKDKENKKDIDLDD